MERAGLPYINPHGERHTHISDLITAGVPILGVSERVGHTNPSFTQSVYGHVQAQLRLQAQDTIEQLYGQATNPEN
ncbi:MAG: tyrosine-type recombinase/integrase [Ktedonobacterales bacterium]|nr:tyrosine-type recombinase/integrase [Ktedonobacterales bacterium]